jgi:hypothetical protein
VGEEFSVLLKTEKDGICFNLDAPDFISAVGELKCEKAGLNVLKLVCNKAQNCVEFALDSTLGRVECNISRSVERGDDGVITGTGDMVYINQNKIVEAIMIDNIISNDCQRHTKKTIKTTTPAGDPFKYVEHSSEFWAYRLVQLVSKLPASYKYDFLKKYKISEEKLDTVLEYVDNVNNQRLYRNLSKLLTELRHTYAAYTL